MATEMTPMIIPMNQMLMQIGHPKEGWCNGCRRVPPYEPNHVLQLRMKDTVMTFCPICADAAVRMFVSFGYGTKTTNEEIVQAARYRKLRAWMSSNVQEGWTQVEQLGAIAAWVSWEDFDKSLDALPKCNVGLCYGTPDHLK